MLAPQRGLIATEKSKAMALTLHLHGSLVCKERHTAGIVKLWLPPRQSRGISLRIRICLWCVFWYDLAYAHFGDLTPT